MTATLSKLAQVTWAGLELMTFDDQLSTVVTNVEGWYGTPDVETNDVTRALMDGVLYGPKVAGGKEMTISGAAVGDRDRLMAFRSLLAARTAAVVPADLVVEDPWLPDATMATVRATSPLSYAPLGGAVGFRYEVTVRAADPHRYAANWSQAEITLQGQGTSGREYQRDYPWQYGSGAIPGVAFLTNQGDVPAPVQALYTGPFAESFLIGPAGEPGVIRLAPVAAGAQILVNTATLIAQAPGGASRAAYVLPGSAALRVPPASTVQWTLLSTGTGTVTLYWRSTYA